MKAHMIRLWTINRWFRWTGWRLCVECPRDDSKPSLIGFTFYGWGFIGHEPAAGRHK